MNKIALIILLAAILGAGYFLYTSSSSSEEQAVSVPAAQEQVVEEEAMKVDGAVDTYTLDELRAHDSRVDCWMAIDGKVYDVTEFVNKHPGGDTLLEGCGVDATELFETRPMGSGTPHSDKARSFLPNYFMGTLAQ